MDEASSETTYNLLGMGIMYRHLVCTKNLTNIKDRGVHQRNTTLEHIEHHKLDGIVYFADDDNIYSLELFESLREISRFGAWPVAMFAQSKNKAVLEGSVCNGSLVIGWHTNEKSNRLRRFHVDTSGFAFNNTILWSIKFDIVIVPIVSRYYVRRKILKSGWMIRRLSKKSEFIVFKCSVIYIFGH